MIYSGKLWVSDGAGAEWRYDVKRCTHHEDALKLDYTGVKQGAPFTGSAELFGSDSDQFSGQDTFLYDGYDEPSIGTVSLKVSYIDGFLSLEGKWVGEGKEYSVEGDLEPLA
ncbi:MAG: hypothetical protein P1U64_11845 [Alcanivoracaceae bacterium]|nr:hypothetical protein [Alcanivoracaceae bacterium]